MQLTKCLKNRCRSRLIHGKELSTVIKTTSHSNKLIHYFLSILLFPLPNMSNKFLPRNIPLINSLLSQFLLYNTLSSYSRMIQTWNINTLQSLHSFMSYNKVFNGIHQSVSNVQFASNIRRRKNHHISLFSSHFSQFLLRQLIKFLDRPPLIPFRFNKLRIISRRKRFLIVSLELNCFL